MLGARSASLPVLDALLGVFEFKMACSEPDFQNFKKTFDWRIQLVGLITFQCEADKHCAKACVMCDTRCCCDVLRKAVWCLMSQPSRGRPARHFALAPKRCPQRCRSSTMVSPGQARYFWSSWNKETRVHRARVDRERTPGVSARA